MARVSTRKKSPGSAFCSGFGFSHTDDYGSSVDGLFSPDSLKLQDIISFCILSTNRCQNGK